MDSTLVAGCWPASWNHTDSTAVFDGPLRKLCKQRDSEHLLIWRGPQIPHVVVSTNFRSFLFWFTLLCSSGRYLFRWLPTQWSQGVTGPIDSRPSQLWSGYLRHAEASGRLHDQSTHRRHGPVHVSRSWDRPHVFVHRIRGCWRPAARRGAAQRHDHIGQPQETGTPSEEMDEALLQKVHSLLRSSGSLLIQPICESKPNTPK